MGVLRTPFGMTAHELLDDATWDLTPPGLELPPYAVRWFIQQR